MDPTSTCRLAISVPTYVEQRPDGLDDYHVTANYMRVVDKDKFSWMGFLGCLGEEIVHGVDQELQVTFFDKTKDETVRIDSDSALLHAFDVYWDSRKVPLTVHVVDTSPCLLKYSQSVIITQETQVNCQPIAMIFSDELVLPNLVADDNGEAVDLNDDGNCEADANGDEGLNLDNDGEDDDAIAEEEEEEDIAEDDWGRQANGLR